MGYVKTVIKQKWEHILDLEYKQHAEDHRSYGYDRETEMEQVQSFANCACSLPCNTAQAQELYPSDLWEISGEYDFDDKCTPELLERYCMLRQRASRLDCCKHLREISTMFAPLDAFEKSLSECEAARKYEKEFIEEEGNVFVGLESWIE